MKTLASNALILFIFCGIYSCFPKKLDPLTAPDPSSTITPSTMLLSPADGSVFNNFPRTTTVNWKAVQNATKYTVEIDCFSCCQSNKWCTEVGKTYLKQENIITTNYTFSFAGAQPGRWRVSAISASGLVLMTSVWWGFTYTK